MIDINGGGLKFNSSACIAVSLDGVIENGVFLFINHINMIIDL